MSDLVTGSGPAGSEHDGHDRSETGTAKRITQDPINLKARAFVEDGHVIEVTKHSTLGYVWVSFYSGDRYGGVDLVFNSVATLDRLVQAAEFAKQALDSGDEVRLCVLADAVASEVTSGPTRTREVLTAA